MTTYKDPYKYQQSSQEKEIILSREDSEFVNLIDNLITGYKTIPYSVPQIIIIEIIQLCAKFFYRWGYFRSVETKMFYLPIEELQKYGNVKSVDPNNYMSTNGFMSDNPASSLHPTIINDVSKYNQSLDNHYKSKKTGFLGYRVQLPSFVSAIYNVIQTNSNRTFSAKTLLENLQWQGQTSYMNYMGGINQNLFVLEYVCKLVESQALESILNEGIPFSYNSVTNTLNLMSEITHTLLLRCMCNVPVHYLYKDDLFTSYVLARTKLELRRRLGSHTINLPGETVLNVDEICFGATEDCQKIEDQLKASSSVGDIILMR
jgi:hypothetical protein